MGFQVNTDQIAGLLDNNPGGSVGYRKNTVLGFDPIVTDELLEPIRYFPGQEGNLRLFSAFGVPDGRFPVFDVLGLAWRFRTSPTLMHGRAMSSSMRRFLELVLAKLYSIGYTKS